MNPEKYARSVILRCPTCGCTDFESEDNTAEGGSLKKCASCKRILTNDDLIHENSENISIHLDEMKKEISQDVSKELGDMLRKAFKGNKNIRIK